MPAQISKDAKVSYLIKEMVDKNFDRRSTSGLWEVLEKAKEDEDFDHIYRILEGAVQDLVPFVKDVGSKIERLLDLSKPEREAFYKGLNENGMQGNNVFEATKTIPLNHLGRLLLTTSELNRSDIFSKEAYKVVLDSVNKGYNLNIHGMKVTQH